MLGARFSTCYPEGVRNGLGFLAWKWLQHLQARGEQSWPS